MKSRKKIVTKQTKWREKRRPSGQKNKHTSRQHYGSAYFLSENSRPLVKRKESCSINKSVV